MSLYDPQPIPDVGGEQPRNVLRLSPLQEDLLHWLRQHAPAMADPYVSAITLLQGPPFPGLVRLVCFCMPDLGNMLPQARGISDAPLDLAPPNPSELSGFKRKTKELCDALLKLGDAQGEEMAKMLTKICDLSKWMGRNPLGARPGESNGSKRRAKSLLRALPRGDLTAEEASRWVDEVYGLLEWFSFRHHFRLIDKNTPSEQELRNNVERFERLLLRFTHTFFGLLQRAEQIIGRVAAQGGVPSAPEANHVVDVLNWSPEFQRALFERLDKHWLRPLRERNVFTDPPASDYWPASRYLARVAEDEPIEVATIFAQMETENPSVIGDMLKAALTMPLDVAVALVPAISRAAREDKL